jgi:hypothetical protein
VAFDLDHLRFDRFDALQGYTMTEPVQLASMGIATTELPLKHPRLLPYAQTYFASQSTIDAHRAELCAFLHASHDGWRAALAQPDEAAALLTATDEHPSTMDASAHLAEHRAMLARVALGEVPGPTKAFLVQAAPHEDAVRGLVFGLAKGRIDGLSAIKVSVKNCNYLGHPFSNAKRAIPSPEGGRNSAFRGKY